jgi:SAM-dependent methyltransferase
MLRLLNLGCGEFHHPKWINLDLAPAHSGIIAHDLRRPLPFDDTTFDAAYHSHVLEHLSKEDGERLMHETARVTKPSGIVRVVVPDLERIASLYLQKLSAAISGEQSTVDDYDWMTIELLDQLVRERPGGLMATYLLRNPVRNLEFIRGRIGAELDSILNPPTRTEAFAYPTHAGFVRVVRTLRARLAGLTAALVGGRKARLRYSSGLFRDSGEMHKWMYDRFSLARVMREAGITEVSQCDAFSSRIPDFRSYELDECHGKPRKPDSLYLEGTKRR